MLAPVAVIYACRQGLQSLSTRDLDAKDSGAHTASYLRRSRVYEFFQFLAGFEIGYAFGRDTNRITCLRVTASARAALAHSEAAKAPQFDLLALVQALDYAFENYLDQSLSILLGQLSGVCHVIDKIGFSHGVTSLTKRAVRFKPGELILQEHLVPDKGRVAA